MEFSSNTEINWQSIKGITKGPRKRGGLKSHRLPACATGLVRYRSREQAQQALTSAKHMRATAESLGKPTSRREVRAFKCDETSCHGGWHLTAKPARVEAVAR